MMSGVFLQFLEAADEPTLPKKIIYQAVKIDRGPKKSRDRSNSSKKNAGGRCSALVIDDRGKDSIC